MNKLQLLLLITGVVGTAWGANNKNQNVLKKRATLSLEKVDLGSILKSEYSGFLFYFEGITYKRLSNFVDIRKKDGEDFYVYVEQDRRVAISCYYAEIEAINKNEKKGFFLFGTYRGPCTFIGKPIALGELFSQTNLVIESIEGDAVTRIKTE